MTTIEKYGLKHHPNFFLLAPGFLAITLFGHVFYRMNKEQLERYLERESAKVTANHERIHMLQAKSFKLGYFSFYCRYLYQWVKNLFKYGCKNNTAYYNISFEREAYVNERNFEYNETKWREYKDK
jgi:hypothetical protein